MFKKKVRSSVYQMAELKQGVRDIPSFAVTNVCTVLNLTPDITVGAADNQRIGNKIFGRYFTVNIEFIFLKRDEWQSIAGYTLRMYIVWPRKLSYNDAITQATSTNFPVDGMPDQDNWIYWMDRKWTMSAGEIFGSPAAKNIKFYKRFPCLYEFSNSTAAIPTKCPLLIIASDYNPLIQTVQVVGYTKLSYKDI